VVAAYLAVSEWLSCLSVSTEQTYVTMETRTVTRECYLRLQVLTAVTVSIVVFRVPELRRIVLQMVTNVTEELFSPPSSKLCFIIDKKKTCY
jgi:hypothetical protein